MGCEMFYLIGMPNGGRSFRPAGNHPRRAKSAESEWILEMVKRQSVLGVRPFSRNLPFIVVACQVGLSPSSLPGSKVFDTNTLNGAVLVFYSFMQSKGKCAL